jgi:hypothetical protein
MLEILNQGWCGSLIGFAGVVIGIVGLLLYRASRIKGKPMCQMRSFRLIGKEEQELPDEVDIRFGEESVPRLTLTNIILWNGQETITADQIVQDDPIRLEFPSGDRILKAHVASVTRAVNKCAVVVSDPTPHVATVSFDFLDPQDGMRIELLHTSPQRYPSVQGTLPGIPAAIEADFKSSSDAESFRSMSPLCQYD